MLERLRSPYKLDFSTTNKLFNSVPWQKTADGHLIKLAWGNEVSLATVTKITPLYLVLTLDSIETNASQRVKKQHYASVGEKVGEKNDTFIIREVSGSSADPGTLKLIVQLTDTGESATLSKDKPFRRVDGYSADLKYDPEKKTWLTVIQKQRSVEKLPMIGM